MTKTEQKRRSRRAFLSAFTLTLCLLLTGAGFLIADYNTRLTGFGDETFTVGVQQDTPVGGDGEEPAVTAPGWMDTVWQLLPARWRAAAWLAEGEIASAIDTLTALFG